MSREKKSLHTLIVGGGNNHQALADNHPLEFRTSVIRSDNSSSLNRIDSDKKKTVDTELRTAIA